MFGAAEDLHLVARRNPIRIASEDPGASGNGLSQMTPGLFGRKMLDFPNEEPRRPWC
jgi:hypothetical protein